MVLFPLPDCPTSATDFPLGTETEKFFKTKSSSYLKLIFFISIAVSKLVLVSAFGISFKGDFEFRISMTRSAAAFPRLTP